MRRRCGLAGLLLSAVVLVCAPGLERAGPPAGVLRVTLIDVGQGDAVLVQFPDRHTLLVDAGGSPGSYDVGRRVVMPAAWALGVRKLDWLLVTHPDIDHVGGARSVSKAASSSACRVAVSPSMATVWRASAISPSIDRVTASPSSPATRG